ncbi:MAG: metallophosphoesterase family protein [Bacillota bacterium]
MIRCLHLADLHLGWRADFLDDRAEQRTRERDTLLTRITSWALQPENAIDLVLIVGDLFETHRPADILVETVIRDLGQLVQAGKTVITVPGNHDEITYHDSVYRRHISRWPGILVQNPMPAHVQSFSICGEVLHFYSMAYTGGLTQVAGRLSCFPPLVGDGIHLAAFHGSLDWDNGERGLPIDGQALAMAGYDYVALGHFHRYQELGSTTSKWAYAGMIEGKGFADPGCSQLTIVELGPRAARIAPVAWPTRRSRIEQLDMVDVETADDLEQRITAMADSELLLRVDLTGTASFLVDAELLTVRLASRFFHLEISDSSLHLDDRLMEQWAGEPTVRGYFVRRLLSQYHSCATDEEREIVQLALRRGMAAFMERGESGA